MHDQQGDWLPARAALHPAGLYLALRRIPAGELRDAFMQETVTRIAAPEQVIQIAREDCQSAGESGSPAGIIYHVARAGSTLVAQMLKQLPGCVVYSEPLPFNELLLPPHAWPRGDLVKALRALGSAFAGHAQRPYVLKLTSWNAYFCELLSEAFPATPWVLCVRDPVEVGVSQMGQLSGWLRGTDEGSRQLIAVVDPGRKAKSREELVARAYGALCEAACELDPARGRLVPYTSLPTAVWEFVAPHFRLTVDGAARLRMAEISRRDAKAPLSKPAAFVDDSAAKQAAASQALRLAVDSLALPSLQRLQRIHGI